MLAPFVVNLLLSCVLLLLFGWALDVISGWMDSHALRDATMAPTENGRHNGARHPSRNLRFDDVRPGPARKDHETPQAAAPVTAEAEGHSGRRFVVVAVIVVLLTWGALYLAFQRWRANYRARVAYGTSNVVPAVGPAQRGHTARRRSNFLARCGRQDARHAHDGGCLEPA